jgi:hypothetical protein
MGKDIGIDKIVDMIYEYWQSYENQTKITLSKVQIK